jgi:hypothetical protein
MEKRRKQREGWGTLKFSRTMRNHEPKSTARRGCVTKLEGDLAEGGGVA